ncbi:hypothetical protein AB0L49_23590 [Streptomyces antimycoticus]|uniref:hypothetical protein n=1 Tax=Streptomyces antimycoticus TaxID=68175 RepID=UPI0034161CDB
MTCDPSALSWAVAAGATAASIRTEWRAGRAAEIPIGQLWDVLRVTTRTGTSAFQRLQVLGEPVGPALEVPLRHTVEFLVPPGTAAVWPPLPGTRCVGRGIIRCPAADRTRSSGRRASCGRRWIVAPTDAPVPTTDADALVETVTAALARRAVQWLDQVRPALSKPPQPRSAPVTRG